MRFAAAALLLVACAGARTRPPSPVPGGPDAPGAARAEKKPAAHGPVPPGAFLDEVSGTVQAVDRVHHRVTIDTRSGPTEIALDRNTLVYGPRGLGTVLDVTPGAEIRAGRDSHALAFWILLRPAGPTTEPSSTPGQGPSPTAGTGPPATEAPSTAAPPTGSTPGPGAVTAPGPPGGGTPGGGGPPAGARP
jgi:hypothetical protein